MQEFIDVIYGYVWSPALVYLAPGAGVFFSVLTRFVHDLPA